MWHLDDYRCFAEVRGSFQETVPRKTAENTIKHQDVIIFAVFDVAIKIMFKLQFFYIFYPRGASSAQVIAIIVCLSVCLCVCHTPVLYQNG